MNSGTDIRREALKCYLAALIAEGAVTASGSPSVLLRQVIGALREDLPAVGRDMLGQFAEQIAERGSDLFGTLAGPKIADFIRDVKQRGFKKVWADLQEQYKRGVDTKARSR